MNYINYIKHTISTPDTYHRCFEKDLPEEESIAKRVALVALPFLSLYRPAGSIISVGMGGVRIYTHLSVAIDSNSISDMTQTAIAIIAFVSSIFNFSVGLLVINGIDLAQGLNKVFIHLLRKEWNPALEEVLQVTASALYLAFMMTNLLEYMFVFALVQVAISSLQAKGEFSKGRWLEGVAKIVMGLIRAKQGRDYYRSIQRRNALFELAKYRTLVDRAVRGRKVRELIRHPLMETPEGHFHGFGKQWVKGENLTIREREVEGKEIVQLEFKVNHLFRDKLQRLVDEFSTYDREKVREILSFTGSHATGLTLKKGDFFPESAKSQSSFFGIESFSVAHQINLVGLGTIFVGSNPASLNLYDRVVIQLPKGATVFDFHEMMAFISLDEALSLSSAEDIERLKLGHLYRIFFPRDALPLERSEEFFSLSLIDLKEKIFAKTPEMREVYETYFHKMVPEQIFPGKVRYKVPGLAKRAHELGARALTAAITAAYSEEELYARVASILDLGMLSTETRYVNQITSHGLGGGGIDFYSGAADSIFTQMITQKNCDDQITFDQFAYQSKVRLLIDLEAIETGSYQYLVDSFGNRIVDSDSWWWGSESSYSHRLNILEFTQSLQQAPTYEYLSNEVMLKERLDPSWIKGLIVPDEATYDSLFLYLKDRGLRFSADFIRIGDKVTSKLIA